MTRKLLVLTVFIFLHTFSLFAVPITMISKDGTKEIIEVDENKENLYLSLLDVEKIEGINSLPKLKKLETYGDFSKENIEIWKEFEKIEILVIRGGNIFDFSFLKYLPNLVAVSILENSYSYYSLINGCTEIDLSNNKMLEYFEISAFVIHDRFPKFINVPDSLLYVVINDNFLVDKTITDQFDELKGKNVILFVDKELKEKVDKIEKLDVHEYSLGEISFISFMYFMYDFN